MRAATVAKAIAWTIIPLAAAEPVASGIFSAGMFGWDAPDKLSIPQLLTSVPTYLWYYPTSATVQWWAAVSSLTALAVVAVPTLYLAYAVCRRRRRLRAARPGQELAEPERAASRAHGDADWLSMDDAATVFPGEDPDWGGIPIAEAYRPDLDRTKRPFDEADPATWGQGGKTRLLLSPLTTGAISGIIIAGSGSFKTMGFTVPAMYTWRGSAVVLDPSTQVGRMVERVRQRMGHHVVLVDPNIGTGSFNVLGCIDLDDPLAIVHLLDFINWCVPADDGKGGDEKNGKFFAQAAREVAICLLVDLLYDESLPRSKRTVKEWRRRLVTPEEQMKELLTKVYAHSPSQYARDLAGTLMRTFKETWSSIYKHVTSDTAWLSIPAFADLLSGDSFDPARLVHGKLTVIVQIPDEVMKATPAVGRVIIGALARIVMRAEGQVATPVPFILDEMDLLKNMPILATLHAMGRKSGAALFPMWQSTGQIERTWGKDGKRSWYASAAWRLYAAVNDEETATEVSHRCGTYTVLARTEGNSTNVQGAFSSVANSRGTSGNVSEQRRDLISAYEVQTALRPDEAIIIPKGKRALRCGRPLYWRRPEMAAQIAADKYRRTKEPVS